MAWLFIQRLESGTNTKDLEESIGVANSVFPSCRIVSKKQGTLIKQGHPEQSCSGWAEQSRIFYHSYKRTVFDDNSP